MVRLVIAACVLLTAVPMARAESDDTSLLTTKTAFFSPELVRRPLVLSHGMVELSVHTEASLASDASFQPVSVAPDLRYGLTERLTVGLIHSNQSVGFIGAVGNGLCLAGAANRCAHLYNRTGFEAVYSLRAGRSRWHAALRGFSMLSGHGDTVPFGATTGVGVRARWDKGRLAFQLDPVLAVGFVRDGDTDVIGQLFAQAQYQLGRRFAAYGGVGYYGAFDEFGFVPVSAGMLFAVDKTMDVAAAVALIDASDSVDARSLTVSFLYRM